MPQASHRGVPFDRDEIPPRKGPRTSPPGHNASRVTLPGRLKGSSLPRNRFSAPMVSARARIGTAHMARNPDHAGRLGSEDLHRVDRQAMQELDHIELVGQDVRKTDERASRRSRRVTSSLWSFALRSPRQSAGAPLTSLTESHPPSDDVLPDVVNGAPALERRSPQAGTHGMSQARAKLAKAIHQWAKRPLARASGRGEIRHQEGSFGPAWLGPGCCGVKDG